MSLPNEWQQRRLRELTLRTATWNPQREARDRIRYVDVSGVDRVTLRIVAETSYSAADAPSRARKIVQAGDTIFATVRPTLRRIAQVPPSLEGEIVSTAFCVLRPDPDQLDSDFLFFATQLESVMSGISALETGASYPAVRGSDVLDQVIPVPPLTEQQDIAAVLDATRSALLHEFECEAEAAWLKRAAMRTLFTRGLRGEAQKETEIGPVPESWGIASIGSIFSIVQGLSLKRNLSIGHDGVPFLRTSNVYWGRIDLSAISRMHVDPSVIGDRMLAEGDLLVCEGGEIGRCAVWRGGLDFCTYQNHLHRLRPMRRDQIDPGFAAAWLEVGFLQRRVYEGAENKTTIPNLSRARLAELAMPIPAIDEQREIVAILDAIDRKIDLHKRKRAVLGELFKALLHKLMTGEIRVADLDLSALAPPKELEAAE
jgi:type I restriction enzyme S subunit